ncbi:hypothetical protein RUM43_011078 [Polyplax serrata]|uniref:Acetyl-CoA acetyltransferase n=1 Tax=Polyplax serrata TaxID=468196 RepID=A0AAN8P4J4_POLSC
MNKSEVFIVSAARTPIGNFCGSLSSYKGSQLGSLAIKAALGRANVAPEDVSEVIMGQALVAGQGQNPARQAAINAGIPYSVPACNVGMLCGSGMKALCLAYQAICCNEAEIVVAGGQESMTQAPHVIQMRNGVKMGKAELTDSMLGDGLMCAFCNIHMGETAENIAKQYSIKREEQDKFAEECQKKTEEAQSKHLFDKEIVPVNYTVGKEVKTLTKDEFPKSGVTMESLAKLRPVFLKDGGTVTAGNASGINDGAAAVVLVSEKKLKEKNLKPLAKVVGFSQAGIEPSVMGLGPVSAVKKLLEKIQWKIEDVDLFELNEAFAAQSLAVVKDLGVDMNKVNVNGGALALGHPIGASGCRIVVTLLHALEQRGKTKGVASLCIGGGMGIAMAVERCS